MSFRTIGKKLGVSEGTIRKRSREMYASGLVKGSTIFPNPRLFGLMTSVYSLDVSSSFPKSEMIERLRFVDGVIMIDNFHGSFLSVIFVYRSNRELLNKLSKFRAIAHAETSYFSRFAFPFCNTSLTSLEWKLIYHLAAGGSKPYKLLANELGVSVRSINRGIERLIKKEAVFSFPNLDYGAIRGGVSAEIAVFFRDSRSQIEAERKILELVDDFRIFTSNGSDRVVLHLLILPNATAINELAQNAARVEGVSSIFSELLDERINQLGVLRKYVKVPKLRP